MANIKCPVGMTCTHNMTGEEMMMMWTVVIAATFGHWIFWRYYEKAKRVAFRVGCFCLTLITRGQWTYKRPQIWPKDKEDAREALRDVEWLNEYATEPQIFEHLLRIADFTDWELFVYVTEMNQGQTVYGLGDIDEYFEVPPRRPDSCCESFNRCTKLDM